VRSHRAAATRPGSPAWGHRNIRGAMMLSTLWGLPFENPGTLIDTAARAEADHTTVAYLRERLVRFAVGVATGRPPKTVRHPTLRDAIAASPPQWEPSPHPTTVN
jgi:hypothetical protein